MGGAWCHAEMDGGEIKKGRKRDYFAIDKAAKKAKRKAVKRSSRKRKVVESAEATSAA